MAAPLTCTCMCGQFQSCTSAQTNPTPDATLTVWGARGRQEVSTGSPAIQTLLVTNFMCTSEKSCTYVCTC